MTLPMIGALAATIVFVFCLSNSKIPNFTGFFLMAPIALYTGALEAGDIYGVLNKNTVHLLLIIGMFSSLIGISHLDVPITKVISKVTGSNTGKKRDTILLGTFFILAGFFSWFLQNNYLTLSLLPVMFVMSKDYKISHSKIIMIAIYATTLGGSCTLIGTNTNTWASSILEGAGYAPLKFFDFAWTGIPCMILGGLYMITFNNYFPNYPNEELPTEYQQNTLELTAQDKKRMKWVGITFIGFVASLVIESFGTISLTPMASATNYMLIPYTNLKFTDFIKAGWPLAIMNALACIFIIPNVFPYF